MPWKFIGSEDSLGGVREVFVDDRGNIVDDARETTIQSSDSWHDYETPAVVDRRGKILEQGDGARRRR